MKIPYKPLMQVTLIIIACILLWNAAFEDDPFVWEWPYIFNAYLFPVAVYFTGIFIVLIIGYVLGAGLVRMISSVRK